MELPVLHDPAGREGLRSVAAQRGGGRAVEQGDPGALHGRHLRRRGDGVRPWSPKCPIPSVRDTKFGRYHRLVSEGPTELVRAPVIGPHQPLPDEVLDALVTVLDEVRLGRSRSRSELVERTGLGRAIVARRVQELIDRGLLSEGDVGPSTGGRPPRHLAFCADAGHVLVADLGATSIDVAVTGLDGRILGHHDEPARIEDGPERALERVDALFESLLRTTQDIPGRLWGIGIGVPGPVEFDSGGRSRRRSCRVGTATRSGNASRSAIGRRSGSTTTSTCWRSASGDPASRRVTTTSWSSRSGPGSAPASSRMAVCIVEPRAAPGTSATSRSRTTRRSCAGAATSDAWKRLRAAPRSGAPARQPHSTAGAPGCKRRSTGTAACRRRTSPGLPHSVIRSPLRSCKPPVAWSARCWRAS